MDKKQNIFLILITLAVIVLGVGSYILTDLDIQRSSQQVELVEIKPFDTSSIPFGHTIQQESEPKVEEVLVVNDTPSSLEVAQYNYNNLYNGIKTMGFEAVRKNIFSYEKMMIAMNIAVEEDVDPCLVLSIMSWECSFHINYNSKTIYINGIASKDVAPMMINTYWNRFGIAESGIDIYSYEGNVRYACRLIKDKITYYENLCKSDKNRDGFYTRFGEIRFVALAYTCGEQGAVKVAYGWKSFAQGKEKYTNGVASNYNLFKEWSKV